MSEPGTPRGDDRDYWIWRGNMQAFTAQIERSLADMKMEIRQEVGRVNTDLTQRLQENLARLSKEMDFIRTDLQEKNRQFQGQMQAEITRVEKMLDRTTTEGRAEQKEDTRKLTILWLGMSIAVAIMTALLPLLLKSLFKL